MSAQQDSAQSLAALSPAPSSALSLQMSYSEPGWLFTLTAHSVKTKALVSGRLPFNLLAYFSLLLIFPKGRRNMFATLLFRQLYFNLETKQIKEVILTWRFLMCFKVNKDTVQLKIDINHKLTVCFALGYPQYP